MSLAEAARRGLIPQPLIPQPVIKDSGRNFKQGILGGARQTPQPKGRTVKPVRGSMNGSERRYAAHLEHRVRKGEVAAFWFEPVKFRLADKTWLTVDFMVKGHLEDDSAVKLKVQSEAYWVFPVKLVREKPHNVFHVREVGR